MNEVFQKLIDRTRAPLDLVQNEDYLRPFASPASRSNAGTRNAGVGQGRAQEELRPDGVKVKWGNLILKIYDKGERVLRIEVMVQNARELRCGKMLEKLPVLLERMNAMLIRFLDTVHAAHISFLDQGASRALERSNHTRHETIGGYRSE